MNPRDGVYAQNLPLSDRSIDLSAVVPPRPPIAPMKVAQFLLRAIDRLRWVALRRTGARSLSVETAIGRVHILDVPGTGRAPPVVLLHGLSSCGVDFRDFIEHLRPLTCRIVTADLPGHGWSDPPELGSQAGEVLEAVPEALDRVLDGPAVVFGNSLGGLVALRFALRRPERVAGLVLSSPAGAPSHEDELPALVASLRITDSTSARDFVRRALPNAGTRGNLIAWAVRARLGRPEIQALLDEAHAVALRPEELRSLTMPVLLLWGENERLLPASHLEFFRRHLPPSARIEVPPGWGHAPFLERPHAVAQRLRRFLAELDGSAESSGTADGQ